MRSPPTLSTWSRRTRTHESVLVGAGPRATQALVLASRAHAALAGRDFVTPDDVKAMARAGAGASPDPAAGVRDRRDDGGGGGREDCRKRGGAGLMKLVPSARLIWLVALIGFPAAVAGALLPAARIAAAVAIGP